MQVWGVSGSQVICNLSWLYVVELVLFLRSEFNPWQMQPASVLGREPSQKPPERRNLGDGVLQR